MTQTRTSSTKPSSGLTRVELLWLLAVGALCIALILGTISRERELARKSQAIAVMEHLEGRLLLKLSSLATQALPDGEWRGLEMLPLMAGDWLPEDPWGGDYQLQIRNGIAEFSSGGAETSLRFELKFDT